MAGPGHPVHSRGRGGRAGRRRLARLPGVTRPHPVPRPLASGPFTRAEGLAHVSPDDLRGPSYQRLLRGAHQVTGDVSTTDRITAALAVLPPGTALAGRSALWSWGVRLASPTEPVDVIVPPGSRARRRAEIRVRRDTLLPGEVLSLPLGLTTSPERTAFDVARSAPPMTAVPMLDQLVRATRLRQEDVLALAARHRHTRWFSRVEPALALVDAGAESVRESQLRLVLVEAGLPVPVAQHVILDADGRFVARTDLAWPEVRVACEYDGAHHDERGQVIRDRARLNAIRRAGWTVVVVDAAQFARRHEVVAMVGAVLAQARRNR